MGSALNSAANMKPEVNSNLVNKQPFIGRNVETSFRIVPKEKCGIQVFGYENITRATMINVRNSDETPILVTFF